jgi:excisionase family DNA binding protein
LRHPPAAEIDYLMTADDVRQRLGISRTCVYRMLAAGTIPSVRVGRLRRVRPADLEQFIAEHLEGRDA